MKITDITGADTVPACPHCLARDQKERADAQIAARQNRIGWWLLGALVAFAIFTAIVSP